MAEHILIAEDEADVLHFLARALNRIKPEAQISAINNGLEALKVFQSQGCDLIISDHRMPGMSGMDLLSAVRQVSAVPFIMISADSMLSQQAITTGANLFLDKPIGFLTLRDAVLRCLP